MHLSFFVFTDTDTTLLADTMGPEALNGSGARAMLALLVPCLLNDEFNYLERES